MCQHEANLWNATYAWNVGTSDAKTDAVHLFICRVVVVVETIHECSSKC